MARTTETSIQATGLSRPDTGAASFVRQAPVDTSGIVGSNISAQALGMQAAGIQTNAQAINSLAQVIPNIVNAGLEIHKQHAISELQEAHNVEIDNFLNSQKNPDVAKVAQENVATGDLAAKSLFSRMQQGTATVQQMENVNAEFAQDTKALTKAVQQGVMQPSELRMRLLKITREHINRNPGLSNELINHAEKVLALSGISSLRDTKQKLDDSAAKAFEKQKDFLIKDAQNNKVPFDLLNLNTPNDLAVLQDDLNKKKRSMAAFSNFEQDEKIRTIGNSRDADTFMRKMGPDLMRGGVDSFHIDASELLKQNAQNPEQIPLLLGNLAQEYIGRATEQIGGVVNLASPEARLTYDRYVESINNAVARISKSAKGEDLIASLDNQVKTDSLLNEKALRSDINIEALNLAAKHPGLLDKWILRDDATMDRVIRTTSALLFDSPNDPSVLRSMKSKTSRNPGMNDAVAISQGFLEAGDVDSFRKSLRIYNDATKSGQMTQAEVYDFMDNFVDTFSQRHMGDIARKSADKSDVIQMSELAGQYLTFVGNAINSKSQGQNVQAKEIEGVGVTYKAPGNPELERQLNHLYANKVNKMIKVFTNIGGLSHGEAWNLIKTNYGSQIGLSSETPGKRGQNENNPLNLKVPGENKFQAFPTKEAGIKASFSQLLKYNDGSSANVDRPLTTPLEMLRVWNNAAEKGSATDKQYASNVARFSGLDLSQDISPQDTDSWVDLLYGMAIAEGAKNVTRKDIRQSISGGGA